MRTYETTIEEFDGQSLIVFPDELCKEWGIKVGDKLNIEIQDKDSLIITKVKQS